MIFTNISLKPCGNKLGEMGTHTTLEVGTRMIEVFSILLGSNPRAHGTGRVSGLWSVYGWYNSGGAPDIKAEEGSSNRSEARKG